MRDILQSIIAVVLYQNLNEFHIVSSFVIAQEAPNHCGKTVPSYFLLLSELLGEFLHSGMFFISGPTTTPAVMLLQTA